ncbi:MAG TPA: DUF4167 domain-containing protein [Devosia sp.]|nr:DUF4167 domain-containing protein [Devosia sp.]
MRPGQQNNGGSNKNRSRGRNNNGGRKHPNPLSRNYESNGPDVKVRGNAAHIAEKYVQLARDAHASGDSVMAENYLQHAEHYFRIVSAAQPQFRTDQNGQSYEAEESEDDFIGDEQADRFEIPQFHQQQNERQQFNNRDDRQPRVDRNAEQPRVEAAVETAEGQEANAAEGQPADAAPVAEAAAENEPRRTRERRPRRRRPSLAEGATPVDPDGPQPDVGELPAFITAGGATNAAE